MIIRNSAMCNKCLDVITSHNVYDFVQCKCGEISIDGGKSYFRRGAKDWKNFVDLSETDEEDE